jgi:hypothetical protein
MEMSWYPTKMLKKFLGLEHSVIIEDLRHLPSPADVQREASRLKEVLEKAGFVLVSVMNAPLIVGRGEAKIYIFLSSESVAYVMENIHDQGAKRGDLYVSPRGVYAVVRALTP